MFHFQLDEHQIEVVPTNRKGSLALKVEPGRIALMVPKNFSASALEQFLLQEQDWLRSNIAAKKVDLPKTSSFDDGMHLRVFGEQGVLQVDRETPVEQVQVIWEDSVLQMRLKAPRKRINSPGLVKKQLLSWYAEQIERYIKDHLPRLSQQVGVQPTQVAIKNYKSRWGSCYPDGRVQFNWRLVMAPPWVIDYVMVHELCHLVHPNHSKEYWALVAQHFPEYQAAKDWLKEHSTELIHF